VNNSLTRDLSAVSPEMARHVLAHYGEGGYAAGSFTMSLISAIARADVVNRGLLASVYPGYVTAVFIAAQTDDGIDRLREIARGV
jgi:hypothetical protein